MKSTRFPAVDALIGEIARTKIAEARVAELEAENALLKRALAMLTRSLDDAEAQTAR